MLILNAEILHKIFYCMYFCARSISNWHSFLRTKIREGKKNGRKKGKPNVLFFFFSGHWFVLVTAVAENLASWNCIYDDNSDPMLL